MIFIYINGGPGGAWWLPLLFLLATWALNGGISQALNILFATTSSMAGGEDAWLALLLDWLAMIGLVAILAGGWRLLAPTRGGQALRQLFSAGLGGGAAAGAAAQQARRQQRPPQQQQQQESAAARQQRWEAVVRALQRLPTDTVLSDEELEAQSVAQLKQRLAAGGANCSGCLEKRELLARLRELGGSSGSSCAICMCDAYAPGDVLRVLPACGHRFHIECVDRWFLASASEDAQHSRLPACPMCNAELKL